MTQKIIFLDIDGPIINTPMFNLDCNISYTRSSLNTQAIGYLVGLCRHSGAKIVTNTMHNTHDVDGRTIKDDLIRFGVKRDYFHEEWKTPFPEKYLSGGRLRGIYEWLENNGDADWICFDDIKFTDSPRLILIDFDLGIDKTAYNNALAYWGITESLIVI